VPQTQQSSARAYRYPFSWKGYLRAIGIGLIAEGIVGADYAIRAVEKALSDPLAAMVVTWVLSYGGLLLIIVAATLGVRRSRRSRNSWVRVDRTGVTVADERGTVRCMEWHEIDRVDLPAPKIGFYASTREMHSVPWARMVLRGPTGRLCIHAGIEQPDAIARKIRYIGRFSYRDAHGRPSRRWRRTERSK